MLKPGGRLLALYMAWLPFDDKIAGASEELILKYSPDWSGARERLRPIEVPAAYGAHFERVYHAEYPLKVHFTRESWHGRIKACRAVGASLAPDELADFERKHKALLERIAPSEFDVLHYAAVAELKVKK